MAAVGASNQYRLEIPHWPGHINVPAGAEPLPSPGPRTSPSIGMSTSTSSNTSRAPISEGSFLYVQPPNSARSEGGTARPSMSSTEVAALASAVKDKLGNGFHQGIVQPNSKLLASPLKAVAAEAVEAVIQYRIDTGDTLSPTHVARRATEVAAAAYAASAGDGSRLDSGTAATGAVKLIRSYVREASSNKLGTGTAGPGALGATTNPKAAGAADMGQGSVPVSASAAATDAAAIPLPGAIPPGTGDDVVAGVVSSKNQQAIGNATASGGAAASADSGAPTTTLQSSEEGCSCCKDVSCVIA